MVSHIYDSAAWPLERLGRPGRISLLGADVQRLMTELIPLVHAQNNSADSEPYRSFSAALQLRSLCTQLVDCYLVWPSRLVGESQPHGRWAQRTAHAHGGCVKRMRQADASSGCVKRMRQADASSGCVKRSACASR